MRQARDGALRAVPALEARPGPAWPREVLDVLEGVTYRGTLPDPALWASHDMPHTLWPEDS